MSVLNLLPFDSHIHQDMAGVQHERIENLESTWIGGERPEIECRDLEILKKGKGGGEAICQSDGVDGQECAVILSKTRVLQTIDEAEDVSTASGGIDGQIGHDSHGHGGAQRLATILLVHPAETVGIDLALLVEKASKTLAEVPLKAILGRVDSLLSPSGLYSGIGTL